MKIDEIEGYRINKNSEIEISLYEFYRYVLKKFADNKLPIDWITSDDKTLYNKVVYVLTVSPTANAIPDMIKERINEKKFTEEELNLLKEIKLKKKKDLSYHSLSETILKRVLEDMNRTEYQYNFMQIVKKYEYDKEQKEFFQNNYSKRTQSPYYVDSENVDDLMVNPQVKKTLRKSIKVINSIIKQYHEYPDSIVIESTKEMNGIDKRNELINEQKTFENLNKDAIKKLEENHHDVTETNIEKIIYWEEAEHKCIYCGKSISINNVLNTEIEHILPLSQSFDDSSDNKTCSCLKCNKEKGKRTPYEYLSSKGIFKDFEERVTKEYKKLSNKKKENLLFKGNIDKYSVKFINRNLRDTAYGSVALTNELKKYNEFLKVKEGYEINIVTSPGQLTSNIRRKMKAKEKDRNYLYHHVVDAMILASLVDTEIGEVLIKSQNDNKYWLKEENKSKEYHEKIVNMLKYFKLKNMDQIKNFNTACDNQPEDNKDGLIKRSYEVTKNPNMKYCDANYVKYLLIDGNFYKISQIDNIYNLNFNKDKAKKELFDILFNPNEKKKMLLCEQKDPKLFNKLKAFYEKNSSSNNPFFDECIYANGLEDEEFNYLKHGIRKTDNTKSPIVVRLRYLEVATSPYLKKEIKNKRKNTFNEFTINKKKDTTLVGLDSLKQVCTRIFYSFDDKKFIFLPINAICFKNNHLNENDEYYQLMYNKLVGDRKVKKLMDLYCGDWVEVIKKDGTSKEGRYKGYHKNKNTLEVYTNGLMDIPLIGVTPNDKAIILYTVDILGNKQKKIDTRDLL